MKPNFISALVMRLAVIACLLIPLLVAAPGQTAQAAGMRYYVRSSGGSDSNSGLSWAQAFRTLQAALTVANSGDEVWVAKGTYYPDNGGPYPLDSRLATFTLEDGVAIYGGFAGNETLLSQRNIEANPTILSGDVDNNDVNTDGNFIAETTSDITGSNAYHVVTTSGNASSAILDGFILTAGQANDSSDPNNKGGGVYAYQSSATLRNLKFSGNYAMLGGGMVCVECAALSLMVVEYINNYAFYVGGGIANINSTLSLTNRAFTGNMASTSGGGMDNSNSTPSLENVTFYGNQAPLGGGMANRFSSHTSLTNVTFNFNVASDKGGGMYNDTSNPGLSNVTFQSNSAVSGGGMYNLNSNPDVLGSAFTSNLADFGGGMNNESSQPYLWMTTFTSNTATQGGGALLNLSGSNANIQMTTFQSNQASAGGGIYNYVSNPFIKNVDFLNNQASSSSLGGGGMFNYDSNPTLERVNFTGNSTPGAGGGMYNYQGSNPSLTDVNFSGNSAYNGGGMRNHLGGNQPQLNRVTFSGNEAAYGGGMSNDNSTPTLTNVTFSGNLAHHQGGGMHNFQSNPNLTNVTFYGNSTEDAGGGGGMYNLNSSQPFLRGVILAVSVNGDCVNGAGGNIAGEYSLTQDTGANACGAVHGVSGFIVGQNPKLAPLANNGGFTLTHALLPGSPAIDAIINNWCANEDQRGAARPQDGDLNSVFVCDIGAVEYVPEIPDPWVGGVVIQSNQAIVTAGRPHLGSQIASYIGSGAGSTTQYVPMLFKDAFGGSYKSALYIQNLSNGSANLTIEFINDSGVVVHTITEPLAAKASKGYWLSSIGGIPAGFAGGAKITADQPILAVGRPHIGSEVMTYNGVSSGSITAWLPMFFKNGFGSYNTALYVQNVTNASASLTIEYLNLDGTVACTDNDTLAAKASKGYWSLQVACDSGSLPSGFVGGVKVTSTQNILAVGRAHLGSQITTYNGFAGGATNAYVPMLFKTAFGGSYQSALYLQNVSGSSANVTIEYVDNAGAVAATQTISLNAGAISSIWLPGVAGLPDGFVGGARITADQNIIAVGRPHLGSEITAYNGASTGSLTAYLPMLFKNAFGVPYNAAFYIQNVTGSAANVSISFYDDAGTLSCIKNITLGPHATQGFWMPTTTCAP